LAKPPGVFTFTHATPLTRSSVTSTPTYRSAGPLHRLFGLSLWRLGGLGEAVGRGVVLDGWVGVHEGRFVDRVVLRGLFFSVGPWNQFL
jgi:hypothetical protein